MVSSATMPAEQRPLHVLNRLAFGPRPGDIDHVRDIGYERYIEEQLYPDAHVPIPERLRRKIDGFPTIHMTPLDLFRTFQIPVMEVRRRDKGEDKTVLQRDLKDVRLRQRVVMREAMEARMLRAIESPRQLDEVMTAFWFNHFNIFRGKGLDSIWAGSFEETAIRPHVLGKFRALLGATARHPAMLFYLDNWQNTDPGSAGARGRFEGINENYAREVMELHTLGVGAGYTQADVIALAHILTGWGIARENPRRMMRNPNFSEPRLFGRMGGFRRRYTAHGETRPITPPPSLFHFDAARHDFSNKRFLGHTIEGGGMSEGEHALDMLASHPATARHLSFQLAQYFVSDNPPIDLVERMATRYLATGGEIRAVLATMFSAPEFWAESCYRSKFKPPYEYVVSCARAAGIEIRNYRPLYGRLALLGEPLYGCQTPNGYANTQDAWLNPDGMMMRLSFATALANGSLPLDRTPFEADADGSRMADRPAIVASESDGSPRETPMKSFVRRPHRAPPMPPIDAHALAQTLGSGAFGSTTTTAVESAIPRLRSALMLGSPEFMMR